MPKTYKTRRKIAIKTRRRKNTILRRILAILQIF